MTVNAWHAQVLVLVRKAKINPGHDRQKLAFLHQEFSISAPQQSSCKCTQPWLNAMVPPGMQAQRTMGPHTNSRKVPESLETNRRYAKLFVIVIDARRQLAEQRSK